VIYDISQVILAKIKEREFFKYYNFCENSSCLREILYVTEIYSSYNLLHLLKRLCFIHL